MSISRARTYNYCIPRILSGRCAHHRRNLNISWIYACELPILRIWMCAPLIYISEHILVNLRGNRGWPYFFFSYLHRSIKRNPDFLFYKKFDSWAITSIIFQKKFGFLMIFALLQSLGRQIFFAIITTVCNYYWERENKCGVILLLRKEN